MRFFSTFYRFFYNQPKLASNSFLLIFMMGHFMMLQKDVFEFPHFTSNQNKCHQNWCNLDITVMDKLLIIRRRGGRLQNGKTSDPKQGKTF